LRIQEVFPPLIADTVAGTHENAPLAFAWAKHDPTTWRGRTSDLPLVKSAPISFSREISAPKRLVFRETGTWESWGFGRPSSRFGTPILLFPLAGVFLDGSGAMINGIVFHARGSAQRGTVLAPASAFTDNIVLIAGKP